MVLGGLQFLRFARFVETLDGSIQYVFLPFWWENFINHLNAFCRILKKLPKIYSPSWYHMLNIMVNFQDTMPKVPTNIWGTWGLKILALFASLNSYRGPQHKPGLMVVQSKPELNEFIDHQPLYHPLSKGQKYQSLTVGLAWGTSDVPLVWGDRRSSWVGGEWRCLCLWKDGSDWSSVVEPKIGSKICGKGIERNGGCYHNQWKQWCKRKEGRFWLECGCVELSKYDVDIIFSPRTCYRITSWKKLDSQHFQRHPKIWVWVNNYEKYHF